MPLRRANAAPLGATIGSSAAWPASGRSRFQGSISKVRIEARVEALEVEHHDVAVEPGQRLEDVSARLRLGRVAREPHAGRDDAARSEPRQVQEVEGGDRGRHAVERHPGEAAALDGELDEPQPLEHLERQARVGTVVLDQALTVLLEQQQDRVRAAVARERLALAQHRARDRVEPVVVHAHEGAAQELDAVEHHAPGHARLARGARCPAGAGAARPGRARARAARARAPRSGRARPGRSPRRSSRSARPGRARARARTGPRRARPRSRRAGPLAGSCALRASAASPRRRRSRGARPRAAAVRKDRSRCRATARASRGVHSAGASSGSSKTTPSPGASRPGPSIATEPRMPLSMR